VSEFLSKNNVINDQSSNPICFIYRFFDMRPIQEVVKHFKLYEKLGISSHRGRMGLKYLFCSLGLRLAVCFSGGLANLIIGMKADHHLMFRWERKVALGRILFQNWNKGTLILNTLLLLPSTGVVTEKADPFGQKL